MLPIDLTEVFLGEIGKDRPSSGNLRCSSDLTGSLRHTQLRLADAPTNAKEVIAEIRALHGELWHEWFHDTLEKTGYPFFHEVKLNDYLPDGWGGRADWVFWHPQYKAFVLGDFKTSRGEAMYWIERNGAKDEHIWQMSAYWHALVKMGLPMVKGFAILYWPMNDVPGNEVVLPSVQECEPVPKELLLKEMEYRYNECQRYLEVFNTSKELLNEALAEPIAREQKLFWNKQSQVFDVKLVPHWLSRFCPYPDELCDCNLQGTTKIGQWVFRLDTPETGTRNRTRGSWVYEARKGYEEVSPSETPSKVDQRKREKELAGG
jgi:hypothetical protein